MAKAGRKPNDQQTPGKWRRKTPMPVEEASTLEPPFEGLLAPLNVDALVDLDPGPEQTSEAVLEPLEGPLPLPSKSRRGRNIKPETIRRETGLAFLNRIVDDPLYLQHLLDDAQKGKLDKQLQLFIWQRLHGRPTEAPKDEGQTAVDVKIVHEFTSPASVKP